MAVDLKSVEYQPDMLINGRVTMKDSFDDDFTSSEEESDEDEYTSEEEDELDPLDVVNKQIIKRTLENLHWALPTTPSSARSCTTNSSGGSKRSGSISRPSGNGKGRVPPGLLGSSNNHEFPQDADGEGEGNPRQGRTLSTAADAKQSRFACPFYQKDPQKHQKYRSCVGPGFETVHRVK